MIRTKNFVQLWLLLPFLFLASCVNLDDITNKLNDHEKRLKILEQTVNSANTSISNLQTLLNAQKEKISITSYAPLKDGSGYRLIMSDGTEIILKNGTDGTTPLIGIKEYEGALYWTIDGEFMLDANGEKIKAEGTDGAAGVTPKLRVNIDGYWEVSVDGGKIWTVVLDAEGNPVTAKGKDATVDLSITETDDAIIIIYNGQTFTIPKKSVSQSGVYKVVIPELGKFSKTNIVKVIDSDNVEIAQICLEYIKSKNFANQIRTIYIMKDGSIDNTHAVSLEDGADIKWNLETNECTYTPGTIDNIKEIYIDTTDGTISTTTESKKILETSLEDYILIDVRNTEENSYGITKIGNQYWMSENLKTLYYTDGTPITTNLNKEDWLATTEGAVTAYDGDQANIPVMGALYNWYAVTNEKGLAPKGYRVTTDEDWAIMAKYLDPENYGIDDTGIRESETIAPLLKSVDGWISDGNGNNLSGLNIYPHGSTSESKYMDYSGKGRQAYFWTSQSYETKTAMFRRLYYDEVFTNRWYENKTYGYSVRCIKE